MWARSELRRRWVALVVLGLLAGVTTGLATAAVAGARRTDTSWERLRDVTHASDAIVFASQAGIRSDDELDYDTFTRLPYVEAIGAFGVWDATGEPAQSGGYMTTYGDWLHGLDTPRIVEGRAPDPDDPLEVVLSEPEAGSPTAGLGVGDTIDAHFVTQEQQLAGRVDEPEGPAVRFRIVGISESPFDLAAIPSTGDLYVGPAFREHYGPGLAAFSNLVVKLQDPERDLPRLEAAVARKYPGRGVPVYDLAAAGKRVTNGTDLERYGLLLFAAAVATAGIVIIGQALTRSVRAAGADVPTLVSLGFSRRDAAYALALPHVVSAVVAAAIAVVVAIALSSRFPIGLGREVDPDVGLHVDLPVVVAGALLVVVALAGAVALTAWRAASAVGASPWSARSGIASMLLRLGAPVTASIGAGLALEPGRGHRALPTRPAVVGAVAGVLGVIGALTLAAGIGDAATHGERFGSVWDVEVQAGDAPDDAFLTAPDKLATDPDVSDVTRLARLTIPVGHVVVPFYAIDEVAGSMDFVLLDGRPPERPGEVVLGPDSADTLAAGVGDDIDIGRGGRFRVVGLALLPTTPHSSYDQGGWLLPDDLARATPQTERSSLAEAAGSDGPLTDTELLHRIFDFGTVLARFGDGVDGSAATARLADQLGDTVLVEAAGEPADQENLRHVRPLPILFAAFSLAVAVGALAHVSASVLRRRRGELAVLRSLGLTPRQARACLGWQATTLAAVGLVVGVPLGVALGRVAWRVVAEATPMVYVAPLAVLALLLVVPVALLVANLLAALPGHRAARLRPADVLRTE
jgi:ABC-type lipoprotein release transport system permease subunit